MTIIPTPVIPWPMRAARTPPSRTSAQPVRSRELERFRRTFPDFVETLRSDREHRASQLGLLQALEGAARRDHVRKILRDRRLHRLYAYEVILRLGRLGAATPASLQELAASCNVFAPVRGEPVTLRYVSKGSGRRWVHDFGPRRRMQQALVAAVLRKLHPPLPAQTLFNGGMPMAFEAIERANREGMTHGVEVDIVNFYGSVRRERLAELLRPLPASTVEHVVWDVDLRDSAPVVVGNMGAGPPSSVSTGLSLGAATSPIVGERIVRELLAVAQLSDTITYADNLFVTGRSEQEVKARIQTIQDSAHQLEVGALELWTGFSINHDLSRPFEFLKREGVAFGSGPSARIEWRPGPSKLNQYRISAADRRLDIAEIDAAASRVRHWRRAYPEWQDGDMLEAEFLAGLAARRFYANANSANLSAAVHGVIIAFLAAGQDREPALFIPTEGSGPGDERRAALIAEVSRWLDAARSRASPPEAGGDWSG